MCDLCGSHHADALGSPECLSKTAERIAALMRESVALRLANGNLRLRIHQLERHATQFEACDSAWCNPAEDWDPAVDTKANAVRAHSWSN